MVGRESQDDRTRRIDASRITLGSRGPRRQRHTFHLTAISDHAETSTDAYRDLGPVLRTAASASKASLRIYEPYNFARTAQLTVLGYSSVRHERSDFCSPTA